jgi:hypothetical protein
MNSDDPFDEKRRSPRRTAFMQASIIHPLLTDDMRCTVRNMSQDGALLKIPHPKNLPSFLWLRLEGESTLRFCTTTWRSKHHLGVEFSEQIIERRRSQRWVAA